jgi:hypothetical protein
MRGCAAGVAAGYVGLVQGVAARAAGWARWGWQRRIEVARRPGAAHHRMHNECGGGVGGQAGEPEDPVMRRRGTHDRGAFERRDGGVRTYPGRCSYLHVPAYLFETCAARSRCGSSLAPRSAAFGAWQRAPPDGVSCGVERCVGHVIVSCDTAGALYDRLVPAIAWWSPLASIGEVGGSERFGVVKLVISLSAKRFGAFFGG